ncbi:major facilitator transporter [Devosia geojensis]|uniref:Major facilitator transporter n=1 Tax=Devosia geojensis TaxID=443610 RepID=A0A0F5FF55_9HYPH|nr:arsenite efflux MFS transporter ArsK [Devosia geojensis]KKB06822.1 major facilitator transporter [Devosia geojensis]
MPAAVIWALGLTQIIGYGTLYYSFSVLAPAMAADFGWSAEWIYAALAGSLVAGGLISPIAGAWADRFGAARVMTWGSAAAAMALVVCGLAPEGMSFVAGLVAIEVASAFVLYATAFAALAQISGRGAQRSITLLTLIAGFASTVFWPLTSALHQVLTWREVYFVFAGLNLLVCLPVHGWLARFSRSRAGMRAEQSDDQADAPESPSRPIVFLLMLAGFAAFGFVSSAIMMHMVPLLAGLGLGAAGVVVTTLFGPAQVASRIINMRFGKGLSQPLLAAIGAGLMPAGLAVLALTAPLPAGAAVFAVLFGLGSGLSSIVSGTLPLVLFGTRGYGRRLGWISSARLVVSAFAPFVFALVAALAATTVSLWMVVGVGLFGMLAFLAIWRVTLRSAMAAPAPGPA